MEAQANHYLVPPQSTPLLSKVLNTEKLQKIKEKTKAKAKFLSKEKETEIENLLNQVIYDQMKKLKAQSEFISSFNEVYALQEEELNLAKEECLAERVAITMLKADNNQTSSQSVPAQKKQHEIFM